MVENIKMRNFAHVIVPHWMVVVRKKIAGATSGFIAFFLAVFFIHSVHLSNFYGN